MDYVCKLCLANDEVRTEWNPSKPSPYFQVGDNITFTSDDGQWRVHYNDNPFDQTALPRDFTGKSGEKQTAAICRTGRFNFSCELSANGKLYGYKPGAQGDITPVGPPPP